MKKQTTSLVLIGALALLATVFHSCRKGCYQCTLNNDTVYRCSDDYDSQKEFNAELKEYEKDNYKCTKM